MTAFEYIFTKQVQWAKNNDIPLEGSQGSRGRLAYTKELDDNLFRPLVPVVKTSFQKGDGGELKSKMKAVHSSSALGVNIFQYWLNINKIPVIAQACGLSVKESRTAADIEFEFKAKINSNFSRSPNIDVVIKLAPESAVTHFAIECKFSEAYATQGHGGIKQKYLEHAEIWSGLPNLNKFAQTISGEVDTKFQYLHPAQLVKHILGLTQKAGAGKFKLLYLWYDVPGPEGARHAQEIEALKAVTQKDGIFFDALSYQALIVRLCRACGDGHKKYLRYISGRYL